MSISLIDALRQVELEPGTYRCELPEHEIVVQVRPRKARDISPRSGGQSEPKSVDPAPINESGDMLDPWVEFPQPEGGTCVRAKPGKVPLPDIPDIPPYGEGDEGGMLDPWIELPSPKAIGTVIARFALPSPPDIPEIPNEDDTP